MKPRFILFAGLLGIFAHDGKAQTPVCAWYTVADPPSTNPQLPTVYRVECKAPIAGPQGPVGPQGPQGLQGPQGPTGPSGTGTGITGGPCVSADNTLKFFIKLPDGTCLPVIVTGTRITAQGTVPGDPLIVAANYFQGKPYPHVTICGVPVEEIRRPVLMRPECAFPGESMALLVR